MSIPSSIVLLGMFSKNPVYKIYFFPFKKLEFDFLSTRKK